ncbi:hypothetical protein [Ferriphaselus sp. R-1]|uniref:hypothetical protein n=1 Tax=Ferriphaselus sp. R-1 TaxID=1485544 RepID=UPI000557D6FE|nr:hypothetical protein [Ferriphaselus sp. R-1]
MEVGTGIFLASLVLGLVLLYGQTKDRWGWKKILVRVLWGSIALGCLTALLIWIYGKYETRVMAQTEFLSIVLGDKAPDVKFKKGNPSAEDGQVWLYRNSSSENEAVVIFKGTEVKGVLYVGSCSYCYKISGLGIGTDYTELREKLGDPTSVAISPDQLRRLASFERWNLVFQLKENRVNAFGIYDPKFGPIVFSKQTSDTE